MMEEEKVYEIGVRHKVAGDHYSDWIDEIAKRESVRTQSHRLDSDEARKVHKMLMEWLSHERTKQAENRMEMAIDADFYDGLQWSQEDAEIVRARGQVPLVYNEVAPMVDWLIGTERRTRIDWRVLPRAEDDVELADIKTKVLKYVTDVNRTAFARSQAFADCVKVGIGWVDDGVQDDPTEDIIYSRYEDWRTVLWDSSCYALDLSDARYVFRWRWVDEDIAAALFPDRIDHILRNVSTNEEPDDWYLGDPLTKGSGEIGMIYDGSRRRVKIIECQFKMPTLVRIVRSGPFRGVFVCEHDKSLLGVIDTIDIEERVAMRTHCALFTESGLLSLGPSIYRHNKYTLTPIWCYRRNKDRLPYGVIRRVRDIQQDLNKRASKALFMLSTNQIIFDKGAFDDINIAREEADAPDGMIEKNPGKEVHIRRDAEQVRGMVEMMIMDAQAVQRSAGINNENLGRQTNAISGEAIKARQLQGAVGTTEIFDNLRFAVQVQGEKQLSMTEQFYTDEKVIRLIGGRGKIDWVSINKPEIQPDGSVRYINDITASIADYIVSEADYSNTMRQVMMDGVLQIAQRMPPEIALRLFVIAMQYSDLPNSDEIVSEIRRVIGDRDPNEKMTPEEAEAMAQQMQAQAEALRLQREQAILALEEQRAKVQKLNAEAARLMAEASAGGQISQKYEREIQRLREQANSKLEALAEQLRKVQADAAAKTLAIGREADVKLEIARIEAMSRERVAKIQASASQQFDAMMKKIDEMASSIRDIAQRAGEEAASRVVESVINADKKEDKQEVQQLPSVNITLESGAIQVDATRQEPVKKTISMQVGDKKIIGEIKSDEQTS